jgi:hypothetical protein
VTINMSDPVKRYGAAGVAKTLPSPQVHRGEPLLDIDPDPEVHAEALALLRLWAIPRPAGQSVYDKAVLEARRRIRGGGRLHPNNESGVREPTHVAEADTEDSLFAETRREFASDYGDFDQASALCHMKAVVVLAASRKPVNEQTYFAALNAVADSSGRRSADSALDKRLEAAEALSDLAEARLAEARDFPSASGYEQRYVAMIGRLADQFGLNLYDDRS